VAASARNHVLHEQLAHLGGRDRVELDLALLAGKLGVTETPVGAKAGIVDQHVDRHARLFERLIKLTRRGGRRHVLGDDLDLDAVALAQHLGVLLQLIDTARHQHEVIAIACVQFAQFMAKAERGAGNQHALADFDPVAHA